MSVETAGSDTTPPSSPPSGAPTEVSTDASPTQPVVTITDEALARIADIREGEEDGDTLVLRIAIAGVSGPEYAYDLSFEDRGDTQEGDVVYTVGDLTVVVPADSATALLGATLDLPSNPMQGGLVIRNPNRPDPLAGRKIELTGTVAEQVGQLLEESINPSLASHGGFASLVGVEDSTVFLTMGGGCQGCSLSAATLQQGIKTAILESIPEVTEVVDVTDHDAGDNPFYT